MSRARAAFTFVVGVLGIALGVLCRFAADFNEGVGANLLWVLTVAGVVLAGLLATWLARPRGSFWIAWGVWPLTAALAVAMPLVGVISPEHLSALLPASAEAAGGLAMVTAALRWCQALIERRVPRVRLDKKKVTIRTDDGDKKIPARSIAEGDKVLLQPGDDIPVDGIVVNGSGFVDESIITGARLPADKKAGEVVLAGSVASIPDLIVRAESNADDALLLRRERLLHGVMESIFEAPRAAKITAAIAWSLAVSAILFIVFWRGAAELAAWLPSLAGVTLAAAVAAPALCFAGARATTLAWARSRGLILARVKDIDALGSVRRWQIDPRLVAAPGSVEVVVIEESASESLLPIACALLEGNDGPEAASLCAAATRKKLSIPSAAALRRTPSVYHGTVNGARWFLGPKGALQADEGVKIAASVEAPLARMRAENKIVWLLGRPDKGVYAAIGIRIEVEADAQTAAGGLGATLMPGLSDSVRGIIAKNAGIAADGPPAGRHDGALVLESSPRPSAGLYAVVVPPMPSVKLRRGGSPRLFAPGLGQMPKLIEETKALWTRARWASIAVGTLPIVIATSLASLGLFWPAPGAAIALVAVISAYRSTRTPAPVAAPDTAP